MKSDRIRYTTRSIFIMALIVLTALPIIVACLIYYQAERTSLIESSATYEKQMIDDVARSVASLYDQFEEIRYEAANQLIALNIPKISYPNYTSKDLENIRILENLLQSMRRTIPAISNIFIVHNTDHPRVYTPQYSLLREKLLRKPWFGETITSAIKWDMYPNQEADYEMPVIKPPKVKPVMVNSYVTGLIDDDINGEFEYLLQIDVRVEYMKSMISRLMLSPNDRVWLYLGDSEILYLGQDGGTDAFDPRDSLYKTRILAMPSGSDMVASSYLNEVNLTLIKRLTLDISVTERELAARILSVALVSLLIASVIAIMVASSVTRPLRLLLGHTMGLLDQGTELQPVTIRSNNMDVESIIVSFNTMIGRVNRLIRSTVEQEREKRTLEIQMLQAQISPHFLYNTLNSIKWIALINRQPAIADAIVALVDLLEFCCKDSDELVTVEEECEFLTKYISLQKMRNNMIVDVRFLLEKGTEKLFIPKFMLQPGVENAILHAFPPGIRVDNPSITIASKLDGSELALSVEDNGVGFDPQKVVKNLTGIGLNNVDERIRLRFGAQYGQTVVSRPGMGTKLTVRLPALYTKEESANV